MNLSFEIVAIGCTQPQGNLLVIPGCNKD